VNQITMFEPAGEGEPDPAMRAALIARVNTNMGVQDLARDVFIQAERLFPGRTDAAMALKLYSEIGEMIESDGDPDEVADVFIMLMDYAIRKNVNIAAAVRNKMEVNEQRQWTLTPGGFKHVK
jgi:hypothetical protein